MELVLNICVVVAVVVTLVCLVNILSVDPNLVGALNAKHASCYLSC